MEELFFSKEQLLDMYKLKNIVRYNHRTRLKAENVAEHSFFTTLITLELCQRLNLDDNTKYKCIIKSLLHDIPETELNDITYDVKVKLNLYPLLKEYENMFFSKEFPEYAELMNDDNENVVNLVVKYADAMSVLQCSYNELQLGNVTFENIKDETLARLKTIKRKLKEALENEKTQ